MARLPYLNQEDLADDDKRLLQRPANLFRLLVHSAEAFRDFSRLGGWTRNGSTLDGRLRKMAILQVGYLTGAAYEWAHHIEVGRGSGVTDDDVRAIVTESEGGGSTLAQLDRLVLRAAGEMTAELRVSDEAFEGLKAHVSNEHIVDLEPEYEHLLREFSLDA